MAWCDYHMVYEGEEGCACDADWDRLVAAEEGDWVPSHEDDFDDWDQSETDDEEKGA